MKPSAGDPGRGIELGLVGNTFYFILHLHSQIWPNKEFDLILNTLDIHNGRTRQFFLLRA